MRRDGNSVAHHLAKLVPFGIEQRWKNHVLFEIGPYVLTDFMSLDPKSLTPYLNAPFDLSSEKKVNTKSLYKKEK